MSSAKLSRVASLRELIFCVIFLHTSKPMNQRSILSNISKAAPTKLELKKPQGK